MSAPRAFRRAEILYVLKLRGPSTAREIALDLNTSASNISHCLNRASKLGLVDRDQPMAKTKTAQSGYPTIWSLPGQD